MTVTAPAPSGTGRGHTVIEKKVVEQVAAQAASEIGAVGGRTGGLLGIGAQADLRALPDVSVELVGRTARLALAVSIAYPASIRTATDEVRRYVTHRVSSLVGVDVTRVDIEVTSFYLRPDRPEVQ